MNLSFYVQLALTDMQYAAVTAQLCHTHGAHKRASYTPWTSRTNSSKSTNDLVLTHTNTHQHTLQKTSQKATHLPR